MALPIVMAALLAGGTLVPHAAGGLIVSSAGGYVAGTYLSTSAVASILMSLGVTSTVSTAWLGTIALPRIASIARALKLASVTGGAVATTATVTTGVETAVVSSAASTAAGASLSTIAIPLIGISLALLITYIYRLIKKVKKHSKNLEHDSNQELMFTEMEAKVIEAMVRYLPQKDN